jgi:hypothetical protein
MKTKECERCGSTFECAESCECWCSKYPPIPIGNYGDCLCELCVCDILATKPASVKERVMTLSTLLILDISLWILLLGAVILGPPVVMKIAVSIIIVLVILIMYSIYRITQ